MGHNVFILAILHGRVKSIPTTCTAHFSQVLKKIQINTWTRSASDSWWDYIIPLYQNHGIPILSRLRVNQKIAFLDIVGYDVCILGQPIMSFIQKRSLNNALQLLVIANSTQYTGSSMPHSNKKLLWRSLSTLPLLKV